MKKNKKAIIYATILVVLIAIGLYLKFYKGNTPLVVENPEEQTETTVNPVSIDTKTIKEENFSGKVAVVSGEDDIAKEAQKYIDQTVRDFKKTADTDVPAMREQFGAESNSAQYEIDIDAKHLKGGKTQSIVMMTYAYTGGAHGSSIYKVITASSPDGKILSLSDAIKGDKREAFTALVRKELLAWRPDGASSSPVFPEEVQALKFDSFTNWSIEENQNDKKLTLYFSQYEIGPGVLGPVAFPISREKIKDFLIPTY
jgi:hypothetical protein